MRGWPRLRDTWRPRIRQRQWLHKQRLYGHRHAERDDEFEAALDFIDQAAERWHNRKDQSSALGLIVRAEDWPYGLRCGECAQVLDDGDRYAERLMGMAGDTPMVKIVCCPCDETAH